MSEESSSIYNKALDILSRREHSAKELIFKLEKKFDKLKRGIQKMEGLKLGLNFESNTISLSLKESELVDAVSCVLFDKIDLVDKNGKDMNYRFFARLSTDGREIKITNHFIQENRHDHKIKMHLLKK